MQYIKNNQYFFDVYIFTLTEENVDIFGEQFHLIYPKLYYVEQTAMIN